ncbi:hypothetical protein FRB99_000300 [Tulasnella sp. 403]|nr:hypothetical protein FRB99_000300 [Tulasnella sp. 403]
MSQGLLAPAVVVAVKKLRALGDRGQRLRIAIVNKFLSSDFFGLPYVPQTLIRELTIWASLKHPNILPLFGFYLNDRLDEAWLVSNYMPNRDINAYIGSARPPLKQRLQLTLDTAEGLQYLHNRRPPVCHGDIKSLNILVNNEGRALICDFGLARSMETMPTGMTTSTFNQSGSIAYQSPELILGTSNRNIKTDMWAWACMAQEIFTGQAPYNDIANPGALVTRISAGQHPASLENVYVPLAVRTLLRTCWSTKPDERPSMAHCVRVLRELPKFVAEKARLIELERSPKDIRFSRDGTLLAVAFEDGVNIYKTLTAEVITDLSTDEPERRTLAWHTNRVHCVDVSFDETYIASGSQDKSVRLWHTSDDTKHRSFFVDGPVWCVALSSDTRYVAAGGFWNEVNVWDVSKNVAVATLPTGNWMNDLAFSKDGKCLVGGCDNKRVWVWDVSAGLPATNAIRPKTFGAHDVRLTILHGEVRLKRCHVGMGVFGGCFFRWSTGCVVRYEQGSTGWSCGDRESSNFTKYIASVPFRGKDHAQGTCLSSAGSHNRSWDRICGEPGGE